jgi:lipid-binding SYLF domain-containing protein
LKKLYASEPLAKMIGEKAKAVLVFPTIVKAGFIVGGQYGEGSLLKRGKLVGHYNSLAASYGLQAGAQSFGYALFLMNDKALEYLDKSDGWELGVGPARAAAAVTRTARRAAGAPYKAGWAGRPRRRESAPGMRSAP